MTKDQKRKSKKRKRNIYRDPEDKRTFKKTTKVDKTGSKQRREVKKSLDTRINGQNILQVSKQKSFYYKDDEGKIVILNDTKAGQQPKVPKKIEDKRKSTNFRNQQLQSKGSENLSKANNSDLYYHLNPESQYGAAESKLFRRKTTRPAKSRRFKNPKPFRGCDSVRDSNLDIEKRDHSLPPKIPDFERQKTFDKKQSKNSEGYTLQRQRIGGFSKQKVYQNQTFTDNVRY